MGHEPQESIPRAEHPGVIRRALAAYFADTDSMAASNDWRWPRPEECFVRRRGGLNYAVIVTEDFDTLAVYRLRRVPGTTGPGQLKRLKRPPRGLG
jgi:hypothetical protein